MQLAMADILERHATRTPDRHAVVCEGSRLTYRELDERSTAVGREFLRRNVRPGGIVVVALPNGVDFFVAAFASWKVGATPFPMSTSLPSREQDVLFDLAQPELVVAKHEHGRWPTLIHSLLTETPTEPLPLPQVPSCQPWKAIASGGSTGHPKLILASQSAVVDPEVAQYTVTPEEVVLAPGPLYHQGPFIFTTGAVFTGGTAVTMERFDATRTLELLESERVNWTYLVPTMMHRIWRLPEHTRRAADLSSLRLLVSTGAPWPAWLKTEWLHWLGPERVMELYGGTEEQGGLSITGSEALDHPGAAGHAHGGVRVVDQQGRDLPTGEVGELLFYASPDRAPTVLGKDREEDNQQDENWHSYGDFAWIGADGYVYIADRRTDLIVSGGVNVYPAEVEGTLESHPAIVCAVVIGLPDDDLGQRVHAIVQLDQAADPVEADQLRAYTRERLAHPKVPRTFELVDEELRDDAGKVRRGALRAARIHPPVQLSRPALDVALVVHDLDQALAFYRDTLSLEVKGEHKIRDVGRMVLLRAGEASFKLVQRTHALEHSAASGGIGAAVGGCRYVTFPVVDLEATVDRCQNAGYVMRMSPRSVGAETTVAAFEDPDGNWIELLEEAPAESSGAD